MGKIWKSLIIFLIIYAMFWIIMWGWAIPSTMVTGACGAPYSIAIWIWLIGSILIPIIFVSIIFFQQLKQHTPK